MLGAIGHVILSYAKIIDELNANIGKIWHKTSKKVMCCKVKSKKLIHGINFIIPFRNILSFKLVQTHKD
jgi:hypothetical protein